MCVYESYMSHMGMKTQLDERPRSAPRRKQSVMTQNGTYMTFMNCSIGKKKTVYSRNEKTEEGN